MDLMVDFSNLLASLPADDTAIVVLVVGARLILPLFIPRWPLIIVAVALLDAADQTIFQKWTDLNMTATGSYQSYDKALDIYYLAIAYMATMRNWKNNAAIRVAQFLTSTAWSASRPSSSLTGGRCC